MEIKRRHVPKIIVACGIIVGFGAIAVCYFLAGIRYIIEKPIRYLTISDEEIIQELLAEEGSCVSS